MEVAEARDLPVRWRAFSLAVVHEGEDVPEQFRARMRLATRTLRVVEHLADQDRHDDAGALYTAVGTALHVEEAEPSDQLLVDAARSAGLNGAEKAAEDEALDETVRATHQRAIELAGDDVGSPVLVTADGHAIFGPIVSPRPTGDDALALWESAQHLAAMPTFFELKRSRTDPPVTA